ncbi:uncharacterized protein LOC130675637 [Microplitis mediator]|uniref:uncharacterized protein LOC130675637 n=1 Tax=Microplitis mediator TaxID=375433 RepID=UPI002556362E|nr:uncharacterized protein LOC130675637 [Microplitis mediator]
MESNHQPDQITNSSPSDERIFVTDRESQITYLINRCYGGSFFPRSLLPTRLGPNTETITLTLDLGFKRKFLWEFRVADVDQPTLDSDFIAYYKLFVSQKNLKLEDPTANLSSGQEVGKSNEQPSQQTTSEVDDDVYVIDQVSKVRFILDTGAQVSVIPRSQLPNRKSIRDPNCTLRSVSNSKISTYGTHEMALNFGPNKKFNWNFRVADIDDALLGRDFFRHFKLLVDSFDNTIHYRNPEAKN